MATGECPAYGSPIGCLKGQVRKLGLQVGGHIALTDRLKSDDPRELSHMALP